MLAELFKGETEEFKPEVIRKVIQVGGFSLGKATGLICSSTHTRNNQKKSICNVYIHIIETWWSDCNTIAGGVKLRLDGYIG